MELEEVVIIADESKGDKVVVPRMEDPVEAVDIIEVNAPTFAEIEEEPEHILIEVSEPSGCHTTGGGSPLLGALIMLILTYFIGYILGKHEGQNKKN